MIKKHFKTLLWGMLFLVSMAMPQKASAYWTSCIRNESYTINYDSHYGWKQTLSFWVGVFNYDGTKNAYFSGDVWVTLDGTNAVKLNDIWSMVSSTGDETNYKKNKSNANAIDNFRCVTVNGVTMGVYCDTYYNNWDINNNSGGGKWTMLAMRVVIDDRHKHTVALSGNFRDADAKTDYQISNKATWTKGYPYVTSVTLTQKGTDITVSWTANEQPTEGSWVIIAEDYLSSTTVDVNSMSAEIPYMKHLTRHGETALFHVGYVPKGEDIPSTSGQMAAQGLYYEKQIYMQHVPGDKYHIKKAATCTEAGTAKYLCKYDSKECGEVFTLPALGHNFSIKDKSDIYLISSATCTKDAEYYHKCSRCTDKGTTTWTLTDSKLAHVYTNYTYNNDATCTKAGTKTASCDYGCGNTDNKADETHPMIAHNLGREAYNSKGMYVTKCKDCHDVDSYDYSRDIKANWNTICLPFTTKSTEDTKFYTIASLVDGVITLELAETLEAGHPALVYTTSKTELATMSADANYISAPANASGTDRLVGTFEDTTVPVDDNHYFFGLSANKGTYVQVKNTGVALGAYRAYIECGKNSSNAAGLRQRISNDDADATEISDVVESLNDSETQYFDMNGSKIDGLKNGMNIIKNGDKVVKVLIR